jgi:hypothetical protein
MSVLIGALEILNQFNRERIEQIIKSETKHLPDGFEVSVVTCNSADIWQLIISIPDGSKVCRILRESMGDLVPGFFRIRFRKLLQLIWQGQRKSDNDVPSGACPADAIGAQKTFR